MDTADPHCFGSITDLGGCIRVDVLDLVLGIWSLELSHHLQVSLACLLSKTFSQRKSVALSMSANALVCLAKPRFCSLLAIMWSNLTWSPKFSGIGPRDLRTLFRNFSDARMRLALKALARRHASQDLSFGSCVARRLIESVKCRVDKAP
jgi:hypothetical protein